ncbi:MAG TPA: response regulator transcription factor [Ilumatobacteraceae bacterium]|nr:response regulator transcription factor [Ilumatobacteraceae bacterium]
MADSDTEDLESVGNAALESGQWLAARDAFAAALRDGESAAAAFGLAAALWWLGESQASVDSSTRAYALFRRAGDVEGAVRSATWLCITYKSNFGNFAAANGWIARADRLLGTVAIGPLHAWTWIARAYRMPDLDAAAELTERALAVAGGCDDVDLELVALSQLGRIKVGMGDTAAGFAMIDEAMAAALGGERSSLDTVVYTCCDMLNACEVATDVERAAQWCQVADGFIEQYGCPFLYAECRTLYGGVLAASGRWADADRELAAALHITAGTCPALHGMALTRLAGLRIRQGRLEEAHQLLLGLDERVDSESDTALARAALMLARGDAAGASRVLAARADDLSRSQATNVIAFELLIDAHLAAAELDDAAATADRLTTLATTIGGDRARASAAAARGRVESARGHVETAAASLESALQTLSTLDLPYESARCSFELGRVVATQRPLDAVEHAQRALASFERLGATIDADRVAAFLRSLGVTTRVGPKRVGTLTLREQEVLRLLGLGLSNPELAERLHVSRKTASHHVSSILTKLGLRNRAEAAAYAVRNADA